MLFVERPNQSNNPSTMILFTVTSQRLPLLRHLAKNMPTTTTVKAIHRTISISECCPASLVSGQPLQSHGRWCGVNYNYSHIPVCSSVHLPVASFSSSSAIEAEQVQAAGEFSTIAEALDVAKEEDADLKDDATCVLPTKDDTASGDVANPVANENNPPPSEISSNTITDTAAAITSATADSISADQFQGIPPENVIRTGKILWVNSKLLYGIILQDEPYRAIGPFRSDEVIFSFQHIYPNFNIGENIKLDTYFDRTRRIRFQARRSSIREGALEGFNLRYVEEGDEDERRKAGHRGGSGCDFLLLHWEGAIVVIKSAKARLGWKVFDLLTEASMNEDKELANKVKNEIKECAERIEFARNIMNNPGKAEMERKAKLGEEMYHMLSNIDKVDNIQRRANEAYKRCRDDLSMLGLSLEPNGVVVVPSRTVE